MLFSLVPFAYLPSYSSQADGPDALPYPVHRLSEMQDTLAALADKAVADEIARERTRDNQPDLLASEAA